MEAIKSFINTLSYPQFSFSLSVILFGVAVWSRRLWTKAGVWAMMIIITLFFGISMLDSSFKQVVAKPDNVPIVMMVYLITFFWWYSMYKATKNDEAIAKGEPTFEESESEDKIFTWPDLVFTEFICMVILTVGMVIWSIVLQAPLEEPANLAIAPNPSKAPWYFLGLQEMLVYFDPWMAGVVLPSLIIIGLMAIPYIDTNPKGNGYYTFKERKAEIVLFLFGFVVLWTQLIVIGTFLRGPNWNFFGPYEFWDINKIEPLVNVDLSEIIWIKIFRVGLPGNWFVREIFGILAMGVYFFVLPVLFLKVSYFKQFFEKLGPPRYYIAMSLFLTMMLLPIKMYFRWVFNLKYFIHIQEFFLNL